MGFCGRGVCGGSPWIREEEEEEEEDRMQRSDILFQIFEVEELG